MLDKIKALPHKVTFAIGLTLVLVVSTMSAILPFSIWSMLVEGIFLFIAMLLILSASDKKHSK